MELRNYQKETLRVLQRMESECGNFSTVVNLPTGSGKTKIAVAFCTGVLSEKRGKILWLADKNELLNQAVNDFPKEIKCQAIFDKDKSNVDTEKGNKFAKEADIVFATIGSMVKIYKYWDSSFVEWLGENKLYVIYDEAHHIGASQPFNLFTSLFANRSDDNSVTEFYHIKQFAIVGFTATVFRGDKFIDAFKAFFKDGYDKAADKLYHSNSTYGEYLDIDIKSIDELRVAVADINELMEGYNGEKPVLIEPQIIKVDEFKNGIPPREDKPPKESDKNEKEKYLKNKKAMKYLATRISTHKSEWGKMAVVVNNIQEAKQLSTYLGKDALRCTSDLNNTDAILEKFRTDESGKILVTVHKFDEGIDVPNLETLYLFAKTNSQVVLRQRIGRVVRKVENREKNARVIWQEYPEKETQLSEDEFQKLLGSSYNYKVQILNEQEEDYVAWMQNNKLQLPAIMYRKPLQADFIENYSTWMLLKAEEVFGTDIIKESQSIGFFYNADEYENTEDVIFVRNPEYEGYLQFQRLLQNDWLTLLRYVKKEDITFEHYAQVLGTTGKELLKNIKEVCFYLRDSRYKDSLGKKVSHRLFVRDGDIMTFFKWFMFGKIEYMNLSIKRTKTNTYSNDKQLFEEVLDADYKERTFECKTTLKKLEALRKKLESQSAIDKNNNRKKEYTELLMYGENKEHRNNYQEMLSKKLMMRAGVTDILPRVVIEKINNETKIDALTGVKCIKRKSNTEISESDWILYAAALIDVPNHIYINQEDVREYENYILDYVLLNVSDDKKKQAVKECLLALGYKNNNEIIKYQCRKGKGAVLPKLLQYVIYQKCYKEFAEEIEFVKDDVLHPKCVNEKRLKKRYKDLLNGFGVEASQMEIDPVMDVIHDYRPYLKAVYYYQGIKPEFLCRMVNDLIELSKNNPKKVIDAFGGSGAYTMNGFYTNIQPKQVYNDLGLMNTAFYRCLQRPKLMRELIEQIQMVIDEAFSDYDENSNIQYLSGKYNDFITNASSLTNLYWDKTIKECEESYIDAYNEKVKLYRDNADKDIIEECSYRNVKIEDRLYYINQKMNDDTATIRNVERYFHVFMLQLNTVYLAMTEIFKEKEIEKYHFSDVDLAVLFFFYNTLSHRHFYNDCTINQIGNMMKNYKKWLGYGAECFKKVTVRQKNALNLLKYKSYNKEDTMWYLDIPYAETDSSDYVAQWFDMKKFVEALSNLKGNYIVSSRCNICLPNDEKREFVKISKENLNDISEEEIVNLSDCIKVSDKHVKELNVFSFFSSFVSERSDILEFIESLKIEQTVERKNKDGEKEKKKVYKPIHTEHISNGKEAKYILIPYTKMSEDYYDEDGKVKRNIIENSSVISEDYVRRMLAATHYSNIPVDIMVTDIDIDLSKMPIQPTYNVEGLKSDSVYVMPTFKTGVDASQYMVEPAVIIMKYDRFMEILCSLLYREEWRHYCEEKETRDVAEMFRNLYGRLFE